MEVHPAVLQIAKLLLAEEDDERTAETLFRRMLEITGAERGFIAVREGGSFEQKFDVRFEKGGVSQDEWAVSRALVREAIGTQDVVHSANVHTDRRFAGSDSVRRMGACSVLVAPLHHAGEVFGAVYLERQRALDDEDPFTEEVRAFVREVAEVAALFLRRAAERESLRRWRRGFDQDFSTLHDFAGIVTRDPRMIDLLQMVLRVADAKTTILIRGETGTGKELVARAVFLNSARRDKPLVTINCGALPATLLDAELFGHTKGAFTSADRDRPGRIAAADGGTLFLDEVAEIPLDVQARFLRVLQFGEVQRVGSDAVQKVDVRVIAATHHDLAQLVEAGKFRRDLLYRLKVVELALPPLRERRGDIPLLVDELTRKHWRRHGETPRWTYRAQAVLQEHPFPGNVRELSHVVERACLLATGPSIDIDLLPPEWSATVRGPARFFTSYTHEELNRAREAVVDEVESEFLAGLLRRSGGNVSQAARDSGVQRTYLQRLLAKHRKDAR